MKRTLSRLVLVSSISMACAPTQTSAPAACPTETPAPAASVTPVSASANVAQPAAVPAAFDEAQAQTVATVVVANPTSIERRNETIAIARAELDKVVPSLDLRKLVVVDDQGRGLLAQAVDMSGDGEPHQLVFQLDLAAKQTRACTLRIGQPKLANRADYKVYGRFIRERHDDFAWENDRFAHRMYGPDLETTKKEPLVSSGIDTWVKRVPRLVINDWYMTDDYHQDSGEGADLYGVGKSRGCGGLGIWSDGKLVTSRNFTSSRVLANGPIRLVFELTYAPWEVSKGLRVSETKRVILDAGSQFNRFESTFAWQGNRELLVGVGISKHAGSTVQVDTATSSMRTWEPLKSPRGEPAGSLGCAIVFPASTRVEEHHNDLDYLAVTSVSQPGKFLYFAGSAWDKAGQIRDAAVWEAEVKAFATRQSTPVLKTITAAK